MTRHGFYIIRLIKMETRSFGPLVPVSALITRESRAAMKRQQPLVVWFTGMSGAGKSTLACQLDRELHASGLHTVLLDGDNLRTGLNNDLDFSDASRHESIRRAAEVARLMVDAGLIVIASFISPFRADRDAARALLCNGQFIEVHVDAPLDVLEARDTKGLYRKAREGALQRLTGVDSPYESPLNPELRINTAETAPHEAVQQIMLTVQMLSRCDGLFDYPLATSPEPMAVQ
ncbi:adenylyl-sulfate kinase [Paraburkholderia sediminicola]|uniref:adenylyl-sulfate kinase n=1 Tax=Paraburkholderia sediminicola TaxID=458836 RepID=UPI0038BC14C8